MRNWGRPAIVGLLAVVAIAGAGFATAVLLDIRATDPAVQGAIVGAVAGIAGGLVGASIGAWASRDVANRMIRDAKEARLENRMEARRLALMDERRDAIVHSISIVRSMGLEIIIGVRSTRLGNKFVRPDPRPLHAAAVEIALFTPDLLPAADRWFTSVERLGDEAATWAAVRAKSLDLGATDDFDDPPAFVAAHDEYSAAEGEFLARAKQHLGVDQYSDAHWLPARDGPRRHGTVHETPVAATAEGGDAPF